ncbi:hypothetical protein [Pseudoalteromonas sp. S2755]|uniref:hypothetical protein n=1 Tax=Pseudoalteromonas sp. S2755 TaxID=2066523 RepID=UPI00110A86E3|nr:hypothetical protein [Pseudoalteromonas sp. S2755]TMN34138.1 hypothetical protein CWC03_17255 [Pseudoalteromonas sp. S2755]
MRLSSELAELRYSSTRSLFSAMSQSGQFAKNVLVDAIYERYSFKHREYIDQRLAVTTDIQIPELRVSARHRLSSALNFVQQPVYRQSKTISGKQVLAGYMGAFLRGKTSHWGGAFTFVGKNNNLLLGYRDKGDKDRGIPSVPYGPSIAGAMANVRDGSYSKVIEHINKRYEKLYGG